jgi:hypothetical protein
MRMTDIRISSVSAQVEDRIALDRLLEGVPLSQEICAGLDRPYFARRWESSRERSFWILSDGTTATRLMVTGLNVDETIALWICYDEYFKRAGFAFSARALRDIIRWELDVHAEFEADPAHVPCPPAFTTV